VLSNDRYSEPVVLRVLPLGIGRQREIGIGKAAYSDSTYSRIAVAFPINIDAAFRAEVTANAITAVAAPLINLALAFEPDPVFQVSRAEVEGRAKLCSGTSPPARDRQRRSPAAIRNGILPFSPSTVLPDVARAEGSRSRSL